MTGIFASVLKTANAVPIFFKKLKLDHILDKMMTIVQSLLSNIEKIL